MKNDDYIQEKFERWKKSVKICNIKKRYERLKYIFYKSYYFSEISWRSLWKCFCMTLTLITWRKQLVLLWSSWRQIMLTIFSLLFLQMQYTSLVRLFAKGLYTFFQVVLNLSVQIGPIHNGTLLTFVWSKMTYHSRKEGLLEITSTVS